MLSDAPPRVETMNSHRAGTVRSFGFNVEVLSGLLGPADPEPVCECFAELTVAARNADRPVPGMRAHLEGCPACAENLHSSRLDF